MRRAKVCANDIYKLFSKGSQGKMTQTMARRMGSFVRGELGMG
jgi:hypothetical protein